MSRAVTVIFPLFGKQYLQTCEEGWVKFQGNCYRHFSERETWVDAERKCRDFTSHLASIITPEEQEFDTIMLISVKICCLAMYLKAFTLSTQEFVFEFTTTCSRDFKIKEIWQMWLDINHWELTCSIHSPV
uniref:C-type lectin domain-containing protein n=1 Tax=Erpetoichthys calabaricus TaxID=27687 RepID=A0A8C4TH88_ERPCA